jgi:hypothetical protein
MDSQIGSLEGSSILRLPVPVPVMQRDLAAEAVAPSSWIHPPYFSQATIFLPCHACAGWKQMMAKKGKRKGEG